jgi:GH15 family glucan-1,4-alpha-glucosidase
MTPQIQDYAAIGDGRSVALVSRDGSLDWLCWPRFDSPSLFARLLNREAGGAWEIAPTAPFQVDRSYIDATNVFETRFETATGVAVLTDFMPVASEDEKGRLLWPEHELVRLLKCQHGAVFSHRFCSIDVPNDACLLFTSSQSPA